MTKHVRILGKVIPIWLVIIGLVASGAGAAAGTVLAGKVTGEVNVAASQALLVGAPEWVEDVLDADENQPQQVYNAADAGWINEPNRGIGTRSDDNTAFEAAAELAIGDWSAFNLPIKNASDVPLTALLTIDVPEGIEVEVYAGELAGNIQNPVRIGLNTWKFVVEAEAEYDSTDDCLMIVVNVDDTTPPGYYTFYGELKQIAY